MTRVAIIDNFIGDDIGKELIIKDIIIHQATPGYQFCGVGFDFIYVVKGIKLPEEYKAQLLCRLLEGGELVDDNKGDI